MTIANLIEEWLQSADRMEAFAKTVPDKEMGMVHKAVATNQRSCARQLLQAAVEALLKNEPTAGIMEKGEKKWPSEE